VQPLLTSDPANVGDYRLLGRLGRGSMGAVYLARSRSGRMVAVKVVRSDLAEDKEFRERFRREAQMARSVGGFWTAAVVDDDPDAEQPWLATEYVPGPTLHKAVVDHGPVPEHSALSLAAGLAEALKAIHRADLVHRDLKPANVLLGPDGPRVIDFGISRAATANTMTATGMFLGTPGFFSPEQTIGNEVGPPSDVFALGAVLVFATTGSGPFGGENTPVMLYRVVHAEPDLSRVPDKLRPLLAGCLSKDPAERPSTAEILDQVGEPSPQGDQWLPPAIKAAINEHTARLQPTTADAPEAAPSPSAQRPGARAYTAMQPAPQAPLAVPPVAPSPPAQRPGTRTAIQPAAPALSPLAHERTDKLAPAQPRNTAQQPIRPEESAVRSDSPGPVFSTRGRIAALIQAALMALIVGALFQIVSRVEILPSVFPALQVLAILLQIGVGLSLIKVLVPGLRLKINNDGLRISRAGLSREIPWKQVNRVGVVGRGKKQSVAIWVTASPQRPGFLWWHWVRRYHGGTRMFPIGAAGGWWTRRREVKRLRLALEQYGGNAYDGRLL
jgi:serine/threonine protein kinase